MCLNAYFIYILTFLQMPDVEVMNNVCQNLFHVAGNLYMAIRDESCYEQAITNQVLHTLLKSYQFHSRTVSCLISLQVKKRWTGKLFSISQLGLKQFKRNLFLSFMYNSYLYKCKMDYHWDGATKDGISTKLCTVAHTIVAAISSNNNAFTQRLQFRKHCALVLLPIDKDCREQLIL